MLETQNHKRSVKFDLETIVPLNSKPRNLILNEICTKIFFWKNY